MVQPLEQQQDNAICNHKAVKTQITLDIYIQTKFLCLISAWLTSNITRLQLFFCSVCREACLHDEDAKEIPV